jgi:hypothetical protein
MNELPLNLLIFTTTRGHFGFQDVYKTSINFMEKKLGSLNVFSNCIAHIKVRDNDEEKSRLPEMVSFFKSKNINSIITYGNWDRGMSHQNEYLKDINKCVNTKEIQSSPFTFWFEDDSPIEGKDLFDSFLKAILILQQNQDVLNIRYIREGLKENEHFYKKDENICFSNTFDFQPNISRSRDLLCASNLINRNWEYFKNIQCEMAFRIAMENFSNSKFKFLGFNPESYFSYHIGTPEYNKFLQDHADYLK